MNYRSKSKVESLQDAKPRGEPQYADRGPCCCGKLEGAADGMKTFMHATDLQEPES